MKAPIHPPKFGYSEVKYVDSEAVFKRALGLFKTGKVTNVADDAVGYGATIIGTKPYEVYIKDKNLDVGYCDCYLGQNDTYCKHMLALAIYVLNQHKIIDKNGRAIGGNAVNAENAKVHIGKALRKVGSYDGPSNIWFSYQGKLDVASGMINDSLPCIEPTLENAKYLWTLVLRLSKKLATGGVDDSNGTIGGAIQAIVQKLADFAKNDIDIQKWITKNCTSDTGFGFEDDLQTLIVTNYKP